MMRPVVPTIVVPEISSGPMAAPLWLPGGNLGKHRTAVSPHHASQALGSLNKVQNCRKLKSAQPIETKAE